MARKKWTTQEIKLLKHWYPKIMLRDLLCKFPNRTARTISVKAFSLKIPSAKIWQTRETKILERLFEHENQENLTKLLPQRTWLGILAQGERMGLKRKTNKPRRPLNESYFETWSPNSAYVLGFILADGCIVRGTYKGYSDMLKLGVQAKDENILTKIKRELGSGHKISRGENACYLGISSQPLVDSLKILKIDYNKSLHEEIPEIPKIFKRDFIRGVVDGDGSLWFNPKNYPTISVCGGKNTMNFLKDYFLDTLGVFSSLTQQSSKGLYQISYRGVSAQKIIGHLYMDAGLYLDRKYNLAMRSLAIKIGPRGIRRH